MEILQESQRYIFLFLALVVLVLLFRDMIMAKALGVKFISPQEAYESRRQSLFLDIRTPREIKAGPVIKGSLCIPLAELSKRTAELKSKETPIIIVCRSGSRAPAAGVKLKRAGWEKVYVLRGGVTRWKKDGYFSKYKSRKKK